MFELLLALFLSMTAQSSVSDTSPGFMTVSLADSQSPEYKISYNEQNFRSDLHLQQKNSDPVSNLNNIKEEVVARQYTTRNRRTYSPSPDITPSRNNYSDGHRTVQRRRYVKRRRCSSTCHKNTCRRRCFYRKNPTHRKYHQTRIHRLKSKNGKFYDLTDWM